MKNFAYIAPRSLEEALPLLDKHRSGVALLAGGTDLIVGMRANLIRPDIVMDIKKIPELQQVGTTGDFVSVGAAVNCRRLYNNSDLMRLYPVLGDSARLIGSVQIQGRASIGGNLCNAAPSGDAIPTLYVLGAYCDVAGPRGQRDIPVTEFCVSPRRSSLAEDELLVSLKLPRPQRHSGASFIRFTPRNEMDIAVANAAASVVLDESGDTIAAARVAIGSVAPTVLLVEAAGAYLAGKAATSEHISDAARMAMEAARPISDMRGTVEQRHKLVKVLVQRALQHAIGRARGEADGN